MTNALPWVIVGVLFTFGFIYGPLRGRRTTPLTPAERRQVLAATVGAVLVAVVILCVLILR